MLPGASFSSFNIFQEGSPFLTVQKEKGPKQDFTSHMPSHRLPTLASCKTAPFKCYSDRFTANDVQPAANVPRCNGSAAGTAPRGAPQQPEEQYGGPDAEYDGSAAGTAPEPPQQPEEQYGEPDARSDGPVHSTAFIPGRHRLLFSEGLLGRGPQLCRPCSALFLCMRDGAKVRHVRLEKIMHVCQLGWVTRSHLNQSRASLERDCVPLLP